MTSDKVVVKFVSQNKNKYSEIKAILDVDFPLDIELYPYNIPEYQGNEEDISIAKCRYMLDIIQGTILVEDTSLCFNALNGLPGPYIKDFFNKLGPLGLNKLLSPWEDKSASVKTIFTIIHKNKENFKTFIGEIKGIIVEPRGSNGFGFDCIFQPENSSKTFAEMSLDEKCNFSHRTKALYLIKEYFSCKINVNNFIY